MRQRLDPAAVEPVIVSAATSALTIASSVAWTVALNSAFIRSFGEHRTIGATSFDAAAPRSPSRTR